MKLTAQQIVAICSISILLSCMLYLTNQHVITYYQTDHDSHRHTQELLELDVFDDVSPPNATSNNTVILKSNQQLSPVTINNSQQLISSEVITLSPDGKLLKRPSSPIQQIVFLKVHKCASSTIQNILWRYGYKNNLEFALPANKNGMQFEWPKLFNYRLMMKSDTADILCQHTRFSEDLVSTMNKNATYISIVREPTSQLKSAYIYYRYHQTSGRSLLDIVKYAANNETWKRGVTYLPPRNPIAFDFGLSTMNMLQPTVIEKFLKNINDSFHLVLIVEYFYESLIILRDSLGWTNEDIKFFTINGHVNTQRDARYDKKSNIGINPALLDQVQQRYMKVSSIDYKIYNMFREKLLKVIDANREYLNHEISELKRINQAWSDYCISGSYPPRQISDKRFQPYGGGTYGYVLTQLGLQSEECKQMAYAERVWNKVVHEKAEQKTRNHPFLL